MLIKFWEAALEAEVGISIQTNNRRLLRQHLYQARAEANDPKFEMVVMIMPEKEDELWLVKKDADSAGTDNQGYPKLIQD